MTFVDASDPIRQTIRERALVTWKNWMLPPINKGRAANFMTPLSEHWNRAYRGSPPIHLTPKWFQRMKSVLRFAAAAPVKGD